MKNKIILASSSPRRKELFDKYGIDYTVDFVETEEVLDESLTLFKRLENIALQKAKPLQIKYPNNIIISADTMVTFQDEMLGKPKDREDAKRMLNMLSNNKQVVITAVCNLFFTQGDNTYFAWKFIHITDQGVSNTVYLRSTKHNIYRCNNCYI